MDNYHPKHRSLVSHISMLPDTARISEIVAGPLVSGFAAGKAKRAQPGEVSVPQIRPTQILPEGEIDLNAAYGIGVDNIAERDYLHSGEVLFNNTNSTALVGKSTVFRESVSAVCSNHVTRLQLRQGIAPEFVAAVLNMLREAGYFARLCTNFNNQAGVNAQTLGNVRIPLPPADQRDRLVAAMAAARTERRDKLAAADQLLAGLDDFVLAELGIERPAEVNRRVYAVRLGQMTDILSPSFYASELQTFLNRLRAHPLVSKPLRDYAVINPPAAVSDLEDGARVGFIPMPAVSDGATGEYTFTDRPIEEVRKGYTPFKDGDILWAKITSSMQNGKSCIVEGLPNGVGFGSTEFHVLRVTAPGVSKEFVREFISQPAVRRAAAGTFSGSAQRRSPADFLANLPFPDISLARQQEMVGIIEATRSQARRLRSEAEAGWQAAKEWFEGEVLGYNGTYLLG